jgi:tetratricopeptide (TPR) repeat protein
MRGGISKQTTAGSASRIAEVTLSVLLMAGSSYAAELNIVPADGSSSSTAVVQVAKKPAGERSILVAKGTISEEPAKPVVQSRPRRRLEPISKISQNIPELAEPVTSAPQVAAPRAAVPQAVAPAPLAVPGPTVEAEVAADPAPEFNTETLEIDQTIEAPAAEEIAESKEDQAADGIVEVEDHPAAEQVADDAVNEPVVEEVRPQSSEAMAPAGATALEAVTFHGITPGISTRSEVLSDWNAPAEADTNAEVLSFQFDGLKSVEVNFAGEIVKSIAITLDKPAPISEMITSMQLEGVQPVVISDEAKTHFTQVFPERGVVLTLNELAGMVIATDEGNATNVEQQVSEVLLETINPKSFLLRAQKTAKVSLTEAIADLEQVVTLARNSGEAKYLLSCHNLAIGKAVTAERHAAESVEIEPQNPEFRLQWAKCLGDMARYDRAVAEARKVLELPKVEPLTRAEALEELGQLAALGSAEVSERSIQMHSKAIEIADKLANSEDPETRHAAQSVLIDAHLAIAAQIAQGNFQDKNQAVPQWIERASALTEALIDEDASFLPRRLQVAVSALGAATNLDKPINPKLWVEEAEGTVKELLAENSDQLIESQYDWQLGLAYLHAADIEHLRSDAASAKKFGKLAEEKLSLLSGQRDELPDTGYTMGRLYFQIGAVYAVHEEDHTSACKWYDQAVDLLLNPVPVTTLAVPQQHGDALVSMGVSYWRTSDRERAVELTLAGVELIEEAVDAGLLGSTALSIPYENLSAMYQALGKTEPAARYQLLARKVSGNLVETQ